VKAISAMLVAPRKLEFIEEELPSFQDEDMLIKMDAVGLCHSDLPRYTGDGNISISKYGYREPTRMTYPAVIGHEVIGTVLEVGKNVKRFKVGDKVTGRMGQCLKTKKVVRNADLLTPQAMLFKIPETEKDYLCCLSEPMECVVNIAKMANPKYGQRVAVVGCGFMGLLVIAALSNSGAKDIIAVDLFQDKLSLAKSFGATGIINPQKEMNLSEAAYHMTNGDFFDIVIEITGSLNGLDTALQLVKFSHQDGQHVGQYKGHGKVLLASVYTKREVFSARIGQNLVVRAPILLSAQPPFDIDPMKNEIEAIDSFIDGRLPIEKMITHRVDFKEVATGLGWLENPPENYIKGLVVFC
jgi:threonine dehydrogenase-like Zn-dependent dehydrogenase